MIKELERKVKELERRLNKYENAHTPPLQKKFFDSPSNEPHKTPGRAIGHQGLQDLCLFPMKLLR
ncbi:MAG: hypothetical protein AB1297_04650 [bacterium]